MRPQRLSGPSALLQGRGPGGVEPSATRPSGPRPRVAEGPPGVPGAPGRPPLRLHSSTSSGGGGQTQPSGWGPPAVPSAAAHSVRKAHDFVLEEGEVTLNVAVWWQLGGDGPPAPSGHLGRALAAWPEGSSIPGHCGVGRKPTVLVFGGGEGSRPPGGSVTWCCPRTWPRFPSPPAPRPLDGWQPGTGAQAPGRACVSGTELG